MSPIVSIASEIEVLETIETERLHVGQGMDRCRKHCSPIKTVPEPIEFFAAIEELVIRSTAGPDRTQTNVPCRALSRDRFRRCRADWMAMDELRHEDGWDLY